MDIGIRLENKEDFKEVENVIREAFWNVYKSGCDEHLIVHKLIKSSEFVKELDFVICDEEKIIGNIIYSKAKVINEDKEEFEVLCMARLGVLPSYQSKGIGTLLMNHSVKIAKNLKYKGIIIFGNPKYYHRFGFKNAKNYNIQTSWGENFEEFMALELYEDSLKDISGKLHFSQAFEITEEEIKEFEKRFPYKEKLLTDTQLKKL